MKQLLGSIGLENMRRNSISATVFSRLPISRSMLRSASVVILFSCHLKQIAGIMQLTRDCSQGDDDALQRFFLPAQFLGALIVVPDGGVFRQPGEFVQSCLFAIEVKDTSAIPSRGYPDP